MTAYTDLTVRIRAWEAADAYYPVEVETGDKSRDDTSQFRPDHPTLRSLELRPAAYGEALFHQLFNGEVRRAYDKATARAEALTHGHLRVRLWLDAEAAELHALAWERLYHLNRGQWVPLATSTLTPFSRYTSLPTSEPPLIRERPLKILAAIANPLELPGQRAPANVEIEVANLREALGDLRQRPHLHVTLLLGRSELSSSLQLRLQATGYHLLHEPTTLENLQRYLPGAHIFHFIGHGHFQRAAEHGPGHAALFLEKPDGTWEAVKDTELVARLAATGNPPSLAFLVACESARGAETAPADTAQAFVGLGPQLVQAGVPAVVAMQAAMPVEPARILVSEFYRGLFEHGTVDRALNQARLLLFNTANSNWAIPVLFSRLPDGRLFEPPAPTSEIATLETLTPPAHAPATSEPDLISIPAGKFSMGSDTGYPDEKPVSEIEVAAFALARFPVTNLQYQVFIQAMRYRPPPHWRGETCAAEQAEHPVVNVSWYDARAYCVWLSGKTGRPYRLPTEAEWEKAARGVDKRVWPWGHAWSTNPCNTRELNLRLTTPVAHFMPQGLSPYGVADMAGNVWEWCSSLYQPYPYAPEANPEDPHRAADRVVRGGAYTLPAKFARCASRARRLPTGYDPTVGFRVALSLP